MDNPTPYVVINPEASVGNMCREWDRTRRQIHYALESLSIKPARTGGKGGRHYYDVEAQQRIIEHLVKVASDPRRAKIRASIAQAQERHQGIDCQERVRMRMEIKTCQEMIEHLQDDIEIIRQAMSG